MKILFSLVIFASVIFAMWRLGDWAFLDYDEATYATVYYESTRRDDLLYLTYLGKPWFEKPLYFWLAHVSAKVFGESEFSLRLPSAILIPVTLVLVFLIVYELRKDILAAILSGAILVTTGYFVFIGRQMRPDVPVTFSLLLGFYAFLRIRAHPWWSIIFGLSIALGILFKSIIGLLPYPIILIFSAVFRDWSWVKSKSFWLGNVLAGSLLLPWHLAQHLRFGGEFWNFYLSFNILSRVSETIVVGPKTPLSYHLWQLFTVTQPWLVIFTILGLVFLLYIVVTSGTGGGPPRRAALSEHRGEETRDRTRYQFELATLTTAVTIFIVFIIPQTRLLYYFLPMFPFVAMFLGSLFSQLLKKYPKVIMVVLFLTLATGLTNTFLRVVSAKDRDFFLRSVAKPSRYRIAQEERKVAEIASSENLSLYVYNWQFYPTLIYYATVKNGVHIARAYRGSTIDPPLLLLVPTPLFKGKDALPINVKAGANVEILFQGEAATLARILDKSIPT